MVAASAAAILVDVAMLGWSPSMLRLSPRTARVAALPRLRDFEARRARTSTSAGAR